MGHVLYARERINEGELHATIPTLDLPVRQLGVPDRAEDCSTIPADGPQFNNTLVSATLEQATAKGFVALMNGMANQHVVSTSPPDIASKYPFDFLRLAARMEEFRELSECVFPLWYLAHWLPCASA